MSIIRQNKIWDNYFINLEKYKPQQNISASFGKN